MELDGALSNSRLQLELSRLAAVRTALRNSALPAPKTPSAQRRRVGVVIDAITTVLEHADRPMRAREVHAAAEDLLREAVPWSTVKAALAEHARGPRPRFERVSHGRYRAAALTTAS
jgi:HB1, ASXL, restriction endonuclease HTH domain